MVSKTLIATSLLQTPVRITYKGPRREEVQGRSGGKERDTKGTRNQHRGLTLQPAPRHLLLATDHTDWWQDDRHQQTEERVDTTHERHGCRGLEGGGGKRRKREKREEQKAAHRRPERQRQISIALLLVTFLFLSTS
jgi:hypothetical protein